MIGSSVVVVGEGDIVTVVPVVVAAVVVAVVVEGFVVRGLVGSKVSFLYSGVSGE